MKIKAFRPGDRVEVQFVENRRDDPPWIAATYIDKVAGRNHAVTIDGNGSPASRRREINSWRIRASTLRWWCYAKPAALGRECGFVNVDGGRRDTVREYCASCGCTRKSSDDRRGDRPVEGP